MLCIGILFTWCQLQKPPPVLDTFCQIYKPVYWSPADTRKSKEQNDTNNRKWKKLCGPAK